MKALYLIWPDHVYIDKCIEAGIDTLIVAIYSNPGDANNGSYFNTWDQIKDVFVRYHDKVKCIALPVLYSMWEDTPEGQRFVQANKSYPRSFCPTSKEFFEKRFAPIRQLVTDGLAHSIILDPEHYSNCPHIYSEEIRCDCPQCVSISHEDQWKMRGSFIKAEPSIKGQLWASSWWSMMNYNNTSLMLTEETYMGEAASCGKRWNLAKQQRKVKKECGAKYDIVPGVFIEVFHSPDLFLENLKVCLKHYGSYWIYTQKMMSRWSKIPKTEIETIKKNYGGFYEERLVDEVDPNFFTKLKAIN